MKAWIRIPLRILALVAMLAVMAAAILTGGYFYVEPSVPEAASLREVPFQIPLSIYTRDGVLMAVYGTDRRDPVPYEEIPERLKQAFLAAEDDRFFEHSGVDYAGLARGALFGLRNVVTGRNERIPGGSTITQQVSRTAQLVGREYDPARKFREIILAYRIEDEFTKEEIFNLFLNTTFFGQRANGVASAARTYFNKTLDELTLGEIAIIAGIPQGPSIMNPYNGPERAAERRRYVLRRMRELDYITEEERQAALAEPIVAQIFDPQTEVEASYVADMANEWCKLRYGEAYCHTAGLKITTTVDSRAQRAANSGHRAALEQYDRRHGYRGPIAHVDLATLGFEVPTAVTQTSAEPAVDSVEDDEEEAADQADTVAVVDPATVPTDALATLLEDYPPRYDTEAAVVLASADLSAVVWMRSTGQITLGVEAISWARPYLGDYNQGPYPELVSDTLAAGDIVRLRRLADGSLELAQVPDGVYEYIQGALVSLDPRDGSVIALVGGYDFGLFQYNRVTQARRQPGSSFKPFFYMSALDRGYTLATIVNDAPFTEHSTALERTRAVVNYEGQYAGEIPMRRALFESRNAPADRIIRDIGASYVGEYVERFGFNPAQGERNASLALGSLAVTPLDLAAGYTVIANGGYAVGIRPEGGGQARPYFIERVETTEGEVLYDASEYVERVCPEVEALAEPVANTDLRLPVGNGAATALADGAPDILSGLTDSLSSFRPGCADRVESAQRIWLITTVLKQVVKRGSGAAAGREFADRLDLFGKTGTTNGPRDAWFAGGNPNIIAVAWVGFDTDARELGSIRGGISEQGGRTAIPAWIEFMKVMLEGMPEQDLPRPPGIVELRVVPGTGLEAAECRREYEWEWFLEESRPAREPETNCLVASPLTPALENGSDPASTAPPSSSTTPLFE